ncbi:LysR family transcriptional regulator [Leucobacter allii]|uniref:LysR family transcriptional regulator n=1 Tax=Leucobacter allii TaxID=2932247 RepID=UPI001FD61CC0|nr:LysR family transcriptional regulator [Leucobacter allii]UOR01139.1 LysR family transcriptional regulator [Leucobacter allii]
MHERARAAELFPELGWLAALLDASSLTDAARRTGTSQSTMTRAVQRWGRRLGAPLIRAHGRGAELTAEGEMLAITARRALGDLDDAIRRIAGEPDATLRIGFLRSLGPAVVGELVSSYLQAHPAAHVVHHELSSAGALDALDRGDVDIVLSAPRPPDRFAWRRMGRQPLVLMVPRGHRLAGRSAASVGDIAEERLLTLDQGYHTRRIVDSLLAAAGVSPHIGIETDSVETVANYVAAGQGVAILPADAVHRPRVATLTLTEPAAQREFGLVWHADRPSPRAEALLAHVELLERRHPDWANIEV